MADKYVKKSSIQGVVDIAKTQAGVSGSLTLPQGVVDTITAIEPIVNRGSPSVLLSANSANDKTYPIPKGRFTGGTVTVNPQEKTVTPTTKKQTIAADTNRALKKVTVQPTPLYKVASGYFAYDSAKVSWSITVPFVPEGAALMHGYFAGTDKDNIVGVASEKSGTYYGTTVGGGVGLGYRPGGRVITPLSIDKANKKVYITNAVYLSKSGNTVACKLKDVYVYVIWGK